MMRFLAVYSTTLFQLNYTNSEVYSKFSDKKSKIFSVMSPFKLPKSLRNTGRMHFLPPSRGYIKLSGATLFFIFL